MHLEDEQVERLRHGELVPRVEAIVREHLVACAECCARVAEAERDELEVHALLHHLDHAPPHLSARALARRARQGGFHWGQWAAGIVVTLGVGGAAYAIPGSPLPAWIRAVARWVAGPENPTPRSAPAAGPRQPGSEPVHDPGVAGISVAPGRALVVSFGSPHGRVVVSLTDSGDVIVRAPAGAATFASHVDRLRIENRDPSATFEIQIPRTAPRVTIEVEGRPVFLKEGVRVTAAEPADALGHYILPLATTGP